MLHEFGEAVIDGKEWNGIDFGAAERKLPPGKDIHVLVVSHGNILAKMAGFQSKVTTPSLDPRILIKVLRVPLLQLRGKEL